MFRDANGESVVNENKPGIVRSRSSFPGKCPMRDGRNEQANARFEFVRMTRAQRARNLSLTQNHLSVIPRCTNCATGRTDFCVYRRKVRIGG